MTNCLFLTLRDDYVGRESRKQLRDGDLVGQDERRLKGSVQPRFCVDRNKEGGEQRAESMKWRKMVATEMWN